MRKLVFFIIALMALFNLIRAFATYNTENIPMESLQTLDEAVES
ncbi:MAG: hypothetical protein PQJ58_00715 [Spirochaetales bacterium]|nr:hypothetical protein [Spirochaetales bacterium]